MVGNTIRVGEPRNNNEPTRCPLRLSYPVRLERAKVGSIYSVWRVCCSLFNRDGSGRSEIADDCRSRIPAELESGLSANNELAPKNIRVIRSRSNADSKELWMWSG